MSAAQVSTQMTPERVFITGAQTASFQAVLTPQAVDFLVGLERRFGSRRLGLLRHRAERQARFDAGERPDFLRETADIRAADWKVRPAPADLQDRRVEITGPVDRKTVINALNSGAQCFVADFEDAHSPTWTATLEGQINLAAAVRGTLSYTSQAGKEYRLGERVATLILRPRGWHLAEKHLYVDGDTISASLFDFGLYLFHNARELLARGSGPYFCIPKLESHLEARLWNDVFAYSEQRLGIPLGSIRCTVLIETLPAAFEMDEILYELRDHVCGLNCDRWDYIFSFIKRFHANPEWLLPDRAQLTMDVHSLRSCSSLLIRTCHRRGAHAMGGMAAQIPIEDDPAADRAAKGKVRADKEREAGDGHDGTWVAHPGLVPVALEVFDRHMPNANQLDRPLGEKEITADDLLALPLGEITAAGVRDNVGAAVNYMAAWLSGRGAVPIHDLMADAATAEIARAQLWQWIRHPRGVLNDGRKVDRELFHQALRDELDLVRAEMGDIRYGVGNYDWAARLLTEMVTQDRLEEFLTLPAYRDLGGRPCA